MRYNIFVFGICVLMSSFTVFAQTKIIAHESHSGESSSFSLEKEDNFGLSNDFDFQLDSVIKYKKNAVIEIYHKGKCMSCRLVDTTKQHPIFNDPQVSLDSMQSLFPNVVFVGFDKVHKGKRPTLRGSYDASFIDGQNTEKGRLIKTLIAGVGAFFILLSIILWNNTRIKRE